MHDGRRLPGVQLCDDVAPADWVRTALRPWSRGRLLDVSSLVPDNLPAHARVFHRAGDANRPIRWRDIAQRTGQTLSAATRYNELVGWHPETGEQSPPVPWTPPDGGSLSEDECAAVADVLAGHTATPDECWFCMWEGYGTAWAVLNRLAERAPRVMLEHRNCLLFRGPVRAATAFRSEPWFQSPTLWWPTDGAWCVASELDIYSTYVAAAPAAIQALIANPDLEVLACTADQEVDLSPYPS